MGDNRKRKFSSVEMVFFFSSFLKIFKLTSLFSLFFLFFLFSFTE